MTDYAQMLLEGIDVLIKERLKSINFDATVKCIVTNAKYAAEGQYEVSNGSATFMAYSDNTEYKVDDSVLVIIPNNDYSNQKYILGKDTSNSSTPYVYSPPFSTFIDVTSNLCSKTWDNGGEGLYANGYKTGVEPEQIVDGEYIFSYIWSGTFTSGEDDLNNLQLLKQEYLDDIASLEEQRNNSEITQKEYEESLAALELQYNRTKATYDNNISFLTGYDRLGISAEFQTFLNAYNCTDGDYGLLLKIFLYEQDEPVIKVFSAKNHFFGDIYDFDSFYHQEVVFPIGDIQDKYITRLELYFYQDQNFKDKNDEYIFSKDFNEQHYTTFKEGGYETLTEFFASEAYAEYDPDDISNALSNYLPNLFVKDAYICLGYDAANFEGNDKAFLSSSSSPVYNSSQTEEDLVKVLNLRWAHKDDNNSIYIISRDAFDTMPGYMIRWYREEQGVRSPDAWAGENWRIIATFQPGDTVTATNNSMYQLVIPRIENAQERYKVIITYNDGNGYEKVATSNTVTFYNEEDVENPTQTDLLSGLTIHCGYVRNGNLESDNNQGMFFIYKKGNELVNQEHASRFLYTVPCFTSVKRYADETRPYLTSAKKVVWTAPASYSMILPQYNDKMLTRDTSTPLTSAQNECFFNPTQYQGHRFLLNSKTINNVIKHIVCYNDILDAYEIAFVNYPGELFEDDEITYVPMFQYKIRANYSPAYINNTLQLDVEKDGHKYHAEREFYFGQAGTSGSDYTLIIDFEEHQEALSLYANSDGVAKDYGNIASEYQLVPFLRLANQDGTPFIDLANNTIVQQKGYAFKWDWLTCEVNGDLKLSVQENQDMNKLYPVFFSNSTNRHSIYGTTTSGSTARPLGSAFGYSANTTGGVITPVAGEDAKYAFYEGFRTTEIDAQASQYNIRVEDYYFYDRINNVFVQEFETPKTNVQYYRRKRPSERFYYNNYMYEFTYEKVNIKNSSDYSQYKTLFINSGGNYVLDYYTGYRSELTYYKAVYQGQVSSNSGETILKIVTPTAYKTRITLNPDYLYNGNSPQIYDTMNSLSILRATVSGVKDYDLVAYWPVALRRAEYANGVIKYLPYAITGATYVRYSSSGEMPDFYRNPYSLRYYNRDSQNWQGIEIDDISQEDNSENLVDGGIGYKEGIWELICPTAIEDDIDDTFAYFMKFIPAEIDEYNILSPFSTYIKNAPLYGVQYKDYWGFVRWTQPILVYQDNYPSSTLNQWNGTDLVLDDKNGTILATAIGAGKKESDNTFSGVIMGDWSKGDNSTEIAEQTGIYGFSHGQMSYALKEDGTAFFGKDGSGRIHLMGDKAQIYSSNWLDDDPEGLMFDLDDGIIQIQHNTRFIEAQFNSVNTFITEWNRIGGQRQLFEYREYVPQIGKSISLSGENVTIEPDTDDYKKVKNYYIPMAFVKFVPQFNNMRATPYYLFTKTSSTIQLDSILATAGVEIPDNTKIYIIGPNSVQIIIYNYKEVAGEIKGYATTETYTYINGTQTLTQGGQSYYRISRYDTIANVIDKYIVRCNTTTGGCLFRKNSLYYGRMNIKTGAFVDSFYETNSSLAYTYAAQWNPHIRYYQHDPSSDNTAHYLTLGDRATKYALSIGNDASTVENRNFVVQWDGTLDTKGNVNVHTGSNINILDGGQLRIYDNLGRLAVAGGSENALNSETYDGITGSLVIYNRGNLILDGGNIYAYDGIIYGGEIRGGLFTRQLDAGFTHTMNYKAGYNSTVSFTVDPSSRASYLEDVYGQMYEDSSDKKEFERSHALIDIDAGFLGEWFVSQDTIISRDTNTYLFANGLDSRYENGFVGMNTLRALGLHGLKPPFLWNGAPHTNANIVTTCLRTFYHHPNGLTSWADVGVFEGEKVTINDNGQEVAKEPTTLMGIMSRSSNNGLGIQAEGNDSNVGIKSFAGGVFISGGYKYDENPGAMDGRADFYVQPGKIQIQAQAKTANTGATNGATGSTECIYIKMNKGVLSVHTAKPEDQVGIYARFA